MHRYHRSTLVVPDNYVPILEHIANLDIPQQITAPRPRGRAPISFTWLISWLPRVYRPVRWCSMRTRLQGSDPRTGHKKHNHSEKGLFSTADLALRSLVRRKSQSMLISSLGHRESGWSPTGPCAGIPNPCAEGICANARVTVTFPRALRKSLRWSEGNSILICISVGMYVPTTTSCGKVAPCATMHILSPTPSWWLIN